MIVQVNTLLQPGQKTAFLQKLDDVQWPSARADLGKGRNPKLKKGGHIDPHVDLSATVRAFVA